LIEPFSLKYLLYVLAFHELGYDKTLERGDMWSTEPATVQEFFASYTLIRSIQARSSNAGVRRHLRRIVCTHLRLIKSAANAYEYEQQYERLVFSIPCNWTVAMQGLYEGIIRKVWPEFEGEDIMFVAEPEAILHFARREFGRIARQERARQDIADLDFERFKSVAVVDLGGHNMVGHPLSIPKCNWIYTNAIIGDDGLYLDAQRRCHAAMASRRYVLFCFVSSDEGDIISPLQRNDIC
jgi:hypothetical protein